MGFTAKKHPTLIPLNFESRMIGHDKHGAWAGTTADTNQLVYYLDIRVGL